MRVFYYLDPGKIDVDKNDFGVLEDILGKRRIKISRVSKVNDPLDFQPSFSETTNKDYIEGFRQKWAEIDGKLGLISFSTDIFNILMWSHYARRHTGFALELELDHKTLSRVNYSLIAPEVVHAEGCCRDFYYTAAINRIIRTKAIDWAYEKEWRLILDYSKDKNIQEENDDNGDVVRYFPLPDGSIKFIFIGLKCDTPFEHLKTKLKEWDLGEVDVYKMEQDRTGYTLVCPEYERVRSVRQFVSAYRKKR